MKILIFSDSHGDIDLIENIINRIKPDRVFSLGDYEVNKVYLDNLNIVSVRGNSLFDSDNDPIDRMFNLEGFNLLLTHGHTHSVKHNPMSLSLFAKENNIDIVFYGHTHVAKIYEDKDIYFINPGSLTLPYSPSFSTFSIMDIKNNKANIKIVDSITLDVYKEININK